MKNLRGLVACSLAASLTASSLFAEPPPASAPAPATHPTAPAALEGSDGKDSVTAHTINVAGHTLAYRATAGTLPLTDDDQKPRGKVFFVAYEKIPAGEPANRPITFVFNGGPGAAAIWLHIGAAGPQRICLNANGDPPAPPYSLIDNDQTWLDTTDLVFIDPIGTGFSRAEHPDGAQAFYDVQGDLHSIGDFVRLYLSRHDRWASPKFLAGESYGTTRAAALSNFLLERYGIGLNGLVLISSVLNFRNIEPARGNDLPYALYLPTYNAVAAFHHKAAPAVDDASSWALGGYLEDLAAGDRLPDDRRADDIARLQRYTGLPADVIRKSNLRIDPGTFETELLADEGKVVGRFDGRITGTALEPISPWPDYDPSLSPYLAAYSGAFNDYVRRELKYESDLPYEALAQLPWKFTGPHGGEVDVTDELRQAMAKNPAMKVLVAMGQCDLATPLLSQQYTFDHLQLPAALREKIGTTIFPGGHMLYHPHEGLAKLRGDVSQFIARAAPATQPS